MEWWTWRYDQSVRGRSCVGQGRVTVGQTRGQGWHTVGGTNCSSLKVHRIIREKGQGAVTKASIFQHLTGTEMGRRELWRGKLETPGLRSKE